MNGLVLLEPAGLHPPRGYTHAAVSCGSLIHVAGQVALDASGVTVGVSDFGVQVERALANIELALAAGGTTFASIAAMTIYVVSSVPRSEFAHLSKALLRRLGSKPAPPITLVVVHALLDPEWLVEVQATATMGERTSARDRAMLELGA